MSLCILVNENYTPSSSTCASPATIFNYEQLALISSGNSMSSVAATSTPPPTNLFNGLSPPIDVDSVVHAADNFGMLLRQHPPLSSLNSLSTANNMDPSMATPSSLYNSNNNGACQYDQLLNMYRSYYAAAAAAAAGSASSSGIVPLPNIVHTSAPPALAAVFNSYAALASINSGAPPPMLAGENSSAFALPQQPQQTNGSVSPSPAGAATCANLASPFVPNPLLFGLNAPGGGGNASAPPVSSSTVGSVTAASSSAATMAAILSPTTASLNNSGQNNNDIPPFFAMPFGRTDPFRPFPPPDFSKLPPVSDSSCFMPPMTTMSNGIMSDSLMLPAWHRMAGPDGMHNNNNNNNMANGNGGPLSSSHFGFGLPPPPPHGMMPMPGGGGGPLPPHCFPYGDPSMGPMGMSPFGNPYCSNSYPLDPNRRKNATRESTAHLKQWLYEHRKNPYPTKTEKIMLAIISKMTLTQVSTWFANARRRLKKENKMTWSPRNRSCEDGDELDDDDDDVAAGNEAKHNSSSRRDGTSSRKQQHDDALDDIDVGGGGDDDDCVDVDTVDNAHMDPRAQMMFMYPPHMQPPPPPFSLAAPYGQQQQHFPLSMHNSSNTMSMRNNILSHLGQPSAASAFAAVRSAMPPRSVLQDVLPISGSTLQQNPSAVVKVESKQDFGRSLGPASTTLATSSGADSSAKPALSAKPKIWSLADVATSARSETDQSRQNNHMFPPNSVPPSSYHNQVPSHSSTFQSATTPNFSAAAAAAAAVMLRSPPLLSQQQLNHQQQQQSIFMNNLLNRGQPHYPLPMPPPHTLMNEQQQHLAYALGALNPALQHHVGGMMVPPMLPLGGLSGFSLPPPAHVTQFQPPPPSSSLSSSKSSTSTAHSAFSALTSAAATQMQSSSVSRAGPTVATQTTAKPLVTTAILSNNNNINRNMPSSSLNSPVVNAVTSSGSTGSSHNTTNAKRKLSSDNSELPRTAPETDEKNGRESGNSRAVKRLKPTLTGTILLKTNGARKNSSASAASSTTVPPNILLHASSSPISP